MKALSPRQRDLLTLIARYLEDGVPPSAAQLAQELGLAGESSVTPVLKALAQKGYLVIEAGVRGRQRRLRLTPKARRELGGSGLPVLGSIPAGPLREALQASEWWVERLDEVLPYREGDFLLQVDGDSMLGDGIFPGDFVLIRPGLEAPQGAIAAVCVGEEYQATLKRVWLDRAQGTVTLRPSNPRYPELTCPAQQVRVVGLMRGLIRGSGLA